MFATTGVYPSCGQWEGVWVIGGDDVYYHHAYATVSWPTTVPLISYTVIWTFVGTWHFPGGGTAAAGPTEITHTVNGQWLSSASDTAYPREIDDSGFTIPEGQSSGTTITFTATVKVIGMDAQYTGTCPGRVTHPND